MIYRLSRRQATQLFAASLVALALPAGSAAAEETQDAPVGRWIDVDLDSHSLVAYEGSTAVRTIKVTSGKTGFETPTGRFSIFSRIEEQTMSSETMGVPRDAPEGYHVEHVKYAQYFLDGGYALHANYWMPESVFGSENTSHGCVSMLLDDAKFLWDFAEYGTPVVVHHGKPEVEKSGVEIPDVRGATVADARAKLIALGVAVIERSRTVTNVAAGTVLEQIPPGGRLQVGESVSLIVAEAPKPRVPGPVRPAEGNSAWVPDVIGVMEADAHARVQQAGLSQTYVNYQTEADVPEAAREYFRSIPPGAVLSSNPVAGVWQFRGAPVSLAVRKP